MAVGGVVAVVLVFAFKDKMGLDEATAQAIADKIVYVVLGLLGCHTLTDLGAIAKSKEEIAEDKPGE